MIKNKTNLGGSTALALIIALALSAQGAVNYVCVRETKLGEVFTHSAGRVTINFGGALNTVLDPIESEGGAEYSNGGGAAVRTGRGRATFETFSHGGKRQAVKSDSSGASSSSSDEETVSYLCGVGSVLTVVFINGGDKVRIRFPGADGAILKRVRSGSGSRYQKGNIIFWTQGSEATLTLPGFDGKCTRQ